MERATRTAPLVTRLLGVCALLGACDVFTSFEGEIVGQAPFNPPAGYTEWWTATETCSGRTGDLAAIEWSLATSITRNGRPGRGAWVAPHDIIIVRGFQADEVTVRHEMLHDLLSGDPDHTSPHWNTCQLIPR